MQQWDNEISPGFQAGHIPPPNTPNALTQLLISSRCPSLWLIRPCPCPAVCPVCSVLRVLPTEILLLVASLGRFPMPWVSKGSLPAEPQSPCSITLGGAEHQRARYP